MTVSYETALAAIEAGMSWIFQAIFITGTDQAAILMGVVLRGLWIRLKEP